MADLGGGVSLEEAFRQTLTQTERAELDKYERWRRPLGVIFIGEPKSEYEIAHERYDCIREPLQESFMKQLLSGELLTTGRSIPIRDDFRRVGIPPDMWRILEPNFEESSASGGGLQLVDIQVFEAGEISDVEISADSRRHLAPSPANENRIQLLGNGGVLIVDGEEMYFRGVAQQKVLIQLFEAYKTGEKLMTREVLQNANTNVDDLRKLFGSRWGKLSRVIRQKNGFCWLELETST